MDSATNPNPTDPVARSRPNPIPDLITSLERLASELDLLCMRFERRRDDLRQLRDRLEV